jgi:putative transposase
MAAVDQLSPLVGVKPACQALAVPRASWYRRRSRRLSPVAVPSSEKGKRHSPRALSEAERQAVLTSLHEERFQDCSPAQVYAALLDEGQFHCSIRTMYRLLEARGESRERRDQLTHPPYQKPELLATQANQLWSWDITKLRGPAKWTCYHLYVILDVSCRKQLIAPGQLTIHADRGSSMKSKPVALLMADLGVTKTHSRPHVSDDNPYSESQFRTLKYRPGFPDRFGSIEDARGFCQSFFRWYNFEHHHSGLGLMTPAVVHLGKATDLLVQRQAVLDNAFQAHPERFVRQPPQPPSLPTAVWINKPPDREKTP